MDRAVAAVFVVVVGAMLVISLVGDVDPSYD